MEIRDPIHGSIAIEDYEIPILAHPFFQRLRGIKQLGLSEFAFPGATHTRYLHSIGVMQIATMAFDRLFKPFSDSPTKKRLRQEFRMAALLHDVGHAPLSHSTESVMPPLSRLGLPAPFGPGEDRQAGHEDYTIKAIVDSSFTQAFDTCRNETGLEPVHVAQLISGRRSKSSSSFTLEGVDVFALMHQLVSGELDCDRMDYLLRDSYFCGVSYGQFDLDWLLDNLGIAMEQKTASLAISERALATFDDFLLSRFHMFLMIYFHYRAVCLEKMLERYFSESDEYKIPDNIEEYLKHDDHFLNKVLRNSEHRWAKRIVANAIPPKIYETFGPREEPTLKRLLVLLEDEQIEYLHCNSTGRLSKYYQQDTNERREFELKVLPMHPSPKGKSLLNIHEATDLFSKYSRSHAVNRVHLDWSDLSSSQTRDISAIINGE